MKYLIAFSLAITIPECTFFFPSNTIYFDIKEQAIKSCHSNGIRYLSIESDSSEVSYSIRWDNKEKDAPAIINLSSIDDNYYISKGYMEPIDNKKFKLAPLSKYTIERAQGDAGGYQITVWTDEYGKVVKADPESCPD